MPEPPAKPLLFVLGDSISMHYGPYLEQMVAGRYRYDRKSGQEEALRNLDIPAGANGGDSPRVLAYLRAMAEGGGWRPDVLLLNCGLHDIKTDPDSGDKQVPPEQYRGNLQSCIQILRELGVRTVWVRTTPADEDVHNTPDREFHRYQADVDAYNAIADEVMGDAGIEVLDLYGFTRSLGGSEIFADHVHFPPEIRRLQAAYIAGHLGGRAG